MMLLLFALMVRACSGASTSEIDRFKSGLYCMQQRLMNDREAYYRFIQPYIEEAQQTLKLVQYNPANEFCPLYRDYFDCLLDYNAYCFEVTAHKNPRYLQTFQKVTNELRGLIEKIKKEFNLVDVNVEEEFKKTTELFQKSNRAYYAQLGLIKKCSIKFFSFFR